MTTLVFNANNTEGHHDTAFEFRDTELRKGAKKVATDLVDLYDVYIDGPTNDQVLTYNEDLGKWVNADAVGGSSSGCGLQFFGYGGGNMYVSNTGSETGTGTSSNPFSTIGQLFAWLIGKCYAVPIDTVITIHLMSDIVISEVEYWNYNSGNSFIIDGHGYKIISNQYVYYNSTTFLVRETDLNLNGNIYLSDCHGIRKIQNVEFYHNLIMNPLTACYDDPSNYTLNFMSVFNNSAIDAENITININYDTQTNPEFQSEFPISKFKIKNSSHLNYSGDKVLVLNNSTVKCMQPEGDLSYYVANGSSVITDDTTKFASSTFVNSSLIEYK